ncbi:KCNH7, partial [Symbiodinium microadriaticum]
TDFVFLLDMVLQFFTTYSRTTPSGVVWEVRLGLIAKHYLRSWFCFDLLTVIPFDLLGLLTSAEALKDLKMVKVIRTLRIPFSLPYQQFALLRFLSVLVLMCHWLACVWALTLQLVDRGYPQWIDDVEAVDGEFGIRTRESAWRVYVASFYFCSYTMTSVGYGDFGPKNILERLVCTMMVMVSGLCWAYILGEVCAIVADMNADSQLFRKKMHQLNVMMRDQGLPYELRSRLRSFFLQNRHQIQYQKQLQKVPFFLQFMNLTERMASRGMHTATFEACIADISRRLQCTAYAQADCFTNVQVLHILSKGLVALDNRF